MIRLKNVSKPQYLDSVDIKKVIKNNRRLVLKNKKPVFPPLWNEETVRIALDEKHYRGKCCYTERRRDIKLERDVEHFRPKAEVTGTRNPHPGYWWLAYNWDNLLISCKFNNTLDKKNHFPLLDESKRAYSENDLLENELPVLINPAIEDPSTYITFHWEKVGGRWFSKPIPTIADVDGRGKKTIKITGIDRQGLMDDTERAENGKMLEALAVDALFSKKLMEDTKPGS